MNLRPDAKCLVVVNKCEYVDACDYSKSYAQLRDRRDCYSFLFHETNSSQNFAERSYMVDKIYFILKVYKYFIQEDTFLR